MPLIYNIEPFTDDLIFIKGDTVNMSIAVFLNDVAYDMTGMTLDIMFRRMDGLLKKVLTSSGGTPEITIAANVFTMYDTPFTEEDVLVYDVQVTDLAGDISTVGRGKTFVLKETTI